MTNMIGKMETLRRAEKLLEIGDEISLRYACLELRYTIEAIAFENLDQFKNEIPEAALKIWKPKDIINLLEEFDPDIQEDRTVSISPTGSDTFITLTQTKGLKTKFLSRNYNRLGAFLHAQPVGKNPINLTSLKEYLGELIQELVPYQNAGYINISNKFEFECNICGQTNVKSLAALQTNPVVICLNPKCNAHTEIFPDTGEIKTRAIGFECTRCKGYIDVIKGTEHIGKHVVCTHCDQEFKMIQGWHLDDGAD